MRWILLVGIILSCSYDAVASSSEVNQANRLYRQGQYDQALPLYQKALDQDKTRSSALIHYDFGTALYKSGDYPKAIDHLSQALNGRLLKALPNYNLGNALYKQGDSLKEKDMDSAIGHLEQAIDQYQQVLNVDAKDKDARYNLEFVQKKLEEFKQQKQQQDQQKNQQSKDQKKQDQNSSKDQEKPDKKEQEEKQQDQQGKDKQENKDQKQDSNQKDKEGKQDKDKAQESEGSQENQKNQDQQEEQQEQVSKEELTKKEAREILEDYERTEEPKGLLNFIPKNKGERSVDKDW